MVPNGWEHLTFAQLIKTGDITQIQDGNHGNSHPKSSDFVSSGIPFVMARDLNNGSIDLYNCVHITKEQADSLRIGFAIEGDVLISHKGTVGEVAIVPEVDDYVMLTPQVTYYRMSSSSKLLNRYLYQYFLSNNFQSRLKSLAGQSTRSYLGITAQKELYINLPPLPEQRKIAQILSIWDRGIATTEKLIDASKQQKKALMQQLLTSKKRLIDPKTGKAFEGDWVQVSFGDIAKVSSTKYDPNKTEISFPCIELEHIDQASGVILGTVESKQLASIKSIFQSGDVLFGKLRPYLKKYAYPKFSGVCSTEIWVLKANKLVISEYLYQFIQTNIFISEANKSAGSKMPRADWGVVSELVLKIPCHQEQQKIASMLAAADKEIELLNVKLAHFKQEKKALMQQLLTGKRRVSLSS